MNFGYRFINIVNGDEENNYKEIIEFTSLKNCKIDGASIKKIDKNKYEVEVAPGEHEVIIIETNLKTHELEYDAPIVTIGEEEVEMIDIEDDEDEEKDPEESGSGGGSENESEKESGGGSENESEKESGGGTEDNESEKGSGSE